MQNVGFLVTWLKSFDVRTLANSALVYSDPKIFGPSQFGPRPLSIWPPTTGQFGPFFIGQFGPQKEKFFGQFGPFLLVNSDLFHWSIRTFSIGQFGPFPLVNSDLCHWSIRTFKLRYVFSIKKTALRLKTSCADV